MFKGNREKSTKGKFGLKMHLEIDKFISGTRLFKL